MTIRSDNPQHVIWIPGRPRSVQGGRSAKYTNQIREAATNVVARQIRSNRIDIEVWFAAKAFQRADVDNILKPILDALIGVVYADDGQVRSILSVAVPTNENYGLSCNAERHDRLLKDDPLEFLVKIYSGPYFRHSL